MAIPAAVAIPAAANLAGSAINAFSQGRMNKKQRKWNEHMAVTQRQWAKEDWDMQNKYNSPEQQMQRLREANLNPHLIYGSGSATNTASAVQQPSVGSWNPKAPDVGSILTSPVNAYMETQSFQAQQKLLDAQTLKTLTEVDTKNFDLSQKQRLADTQASIMQSIAMGKKIDNQFTIDENIRRGISQEQNLKESAMRISKTLSDMQLQEMMTNKGNEEIKSIKQMRQKVSQELEHGKVKIALDKLEQSMREQGYSMNDGIKERILKSLFERFGDPLLDKIESFITPSKTGGKKPTVAEMLQALLPAMWGGGLAATLKMLRKEKKTPHKPTKEDKDNFRTNKAIKSFNR